MSDVKIMLSKKLGIISLSRESNGMVTLTLSPNALKALCREVNLVAKDLGLDKDG